MALSWVKNRSTASWVVVSLIISAFLLTAMLELFTKDDTVAARVNENPILWHDVRRLAALQNTQDVISIRDELIREEVLLSAATAEGFAVADEQVARWIGEQPQFQVDGRFTKARYHQVLQSAHIKDFDYRQGVKKLLLSEQLRTSLVTTHFMHPTYADDMLALLHNTRDISYLTLPQQKDKKTFTSQEQSDYYVTHSTDFIEPEAAKIGYVKVSLVDLKHQIPVVAADLEDFYQHHRKDYYTTAARVKARRLLIAPVDAQIDLKTQIAQGDSFDDIVTEYSKAHTISSKEKTDWIAPDSDEAYLLDELFSLEMHKPAVITTLEGSYLIEVLDKKSPQTLDFEAVADKVRHDYQIEQASILFADSLETLAEHAVTTDSLMSLANEHQLSYQQTDWISRDMNHADIPMSLLHKALTPHMVTTKQVSELLEVDEYTYILLQVLDYQPAHQKEFDQVKEEVLVRLQQAYNEQQTLEKGQHLLRALQQQHQDPEKVAHQYSLVWQHHPKSSFVNHYAQTEMSVLALQTTIPSGETRHFVGSVLANGDYMIAMVSPFQKKDMVLEHLSQETRLEQRNAFVQQLLMHEYVLYLEHELAAAKIKIY